MSEKTITCVIQAGKFHVKKGVVARKGDEVELTETQVETFGDMVIPKSQLKAPVAEVKETKEDETEGDKDKDKGDGEKTPPADPNAKPDEDKGKQGGLFGGKK